MYYRVQVQQDLLLQQAPFALKINLLAESIGIFGARMSIINEEANLRDDLVVLKGLSKLANIQEERVLAMRAQERKSGFINPHLHTAIRVYKDLLVSIQEMRFDLGVDEYKRRTPREQIAAAAKEKAETQRQVFEAYTAAGKAFERLDARRVVGKERTSDRNSKTEIN